MTDDLSDLLPKLEERRETAVCPHCGAERMVIRIYDPKSNYGKGRIPLDCWKCGKTFESEPFLS